jgi:chemotaxis protein methyltransferase CheR
MRLSDEVFLQARILIAGRLGLDFTDRRRTDLERGLVHALRVSSVGAPEAYLAWLAALPDENPEWRRLAGYLTIGETYFFRDRACFDALDRHVLPDLIAARRAEGALRLRLWSAACATGEEAYSLAMLLDRLLPDRDDWALTILATDLNTEALATARRGLYREWSLRETPQWTRDQYFHRRGVEAFEVDPKIRRLVTFAPLNLAEDSYPAAVTNTGAMDLILCRNVLMYFTREAQRAAVARLQRALVAGGWLVVSPVEASAELLHPLAPVNFTDAIFYLKEERGAISDQPAVSGQYSAVGIPFGVASYEPSAVSDQGSETIRWAAGPEEVPDVMPASRPAEREVAEPDSPALLKQARALANQGRLDEARRLCEAALAGDRLNPEAHILWGAICQESGDLPAALDALRRVIYLVPDSAPAHFLLGSLWLRQGNRRRGRRCMETAVGLLESVPHDDTPAGGDGLTAGRLLELARAYLEIER